MSFPRKRESITCWNSWTPAYAGVTEYELLEVPLIVDNYYSEKSAAGQSVTGCCFAPLHEEK
jgi:hypothetical protein